MILPLKFFLLSWDRYPAAFCTETAGKNMCYRKKRSSGSHQEINHVLHGCCASCNYFTSLSSSLTEKLAFMSLGLPCYY